ncbi:hypothetical protein F5Y17DRAFT_429644 [Xylariaceae sp. FL0594]|nr:hypothetical protein F5Y17DRAFT_429644 [Xylariaceae sp. FL0594]
MAARHHDSLTLLQTGTSPRQPGHQLRRSITEQPPPSRHHRVHQYLHRRHLDRDERLSLSAGSELRGSLELPRTEGLTPGVVNETNRAVFWGAGDALKAGESILGQGYSTDQNGNMRQQVIDVEAAAARLRESLAELNTFRNRTSARLDEAYSSTLQRIDLLQNSIVAIKELAGMSEEITKNFTSESLALESEIESQISVYEQTEGQKERIQHYQSRIHAVRDKVHNLSQRVDTVRERIEAWEKADKAWQERTRRRLKVLWIVISTIVLVLMFLFLGTRHSSSAVGRNELTETGLKTHERAGMVENLVANSSKNASAMAEQIRQELARKRKQGATQGEEALQVFDEL